MLVKSKNSWLFSYVDVLFLLLAVILVQSEQKEEIAEQMQEATEQFMVKLPEAVVDDGQKSQNKIVNGNVFLQDTIYVQSAEDGSSYKWFVKGDEISSETELLSRSEIKTRLEAFKIASPEKPPHIVFSNDSLTGESIYVMTYIASHWNIEDLELVETLANSIPKAND